MNRRERRAAEKRQQRTHTADKDLLSANVASPNAWPDPSGAFHQDDDTYTHASDKRSSGARPKLLTRILAKLLLSGWVLRRVRHPDVERLLISFAAEAGRPDVADALIRRQSMRL